MYWSTRNTIHYVNVQQYYIGGRGTNERWTPNRCMCPLMSITVLALKASEEQVHNKKQFGSHSDVIRLPTETTFT